MGNLLKARLSEAPLQDRVLYSDMADFGDVALVNDIASRLGIVPLIDTCLPTHDRDLCENIHPAEFLEQHPYQPSGD